MRSQAQSTHIARYTVAVIGLLICLWGIWNAGRDGLSSMLSKYALTTLRTNEPLLAPADNAVSLTPNNPDAHFSRALMLWKLGQTKEAISEYERAAALRPRDYYLWMVLGNSRDQEEDEKGALTALNEAVQMAPFYAQPRWQYGNVLFRAGQSNDGFAEMRRAALSNQIFLPNMIDLAWGATNNDPEATQRLVQPENKQWRLALARFFARKGQTSEAITLFRAAGGLSEQERTALVKELLASKGYAEAYEVWASLEGAGNDKAQASGLAQIINGSFENQLRFDESGFGWQFARDDKTIKFSLDTSDARSGAHALRLDWNGNTSPNTAVASQLVLVEPASRYRLSFSARTQEIVSGGLPLFILIDKNSKDNRVIAQSKSLPKGNSNWQDYSLEFATDNETRAVLINLQRETCGPNPCPIFGRLWLDNFSIQKL
jgi:tetratricopeptide (TPR) repeat protein